MTPRKADPPAPAGPVGEPADPPRVELAGIVKRFGDVLANDGADLRLAAGEVHALVGENGAGKSTLMSVLYGLLAPDGGEIRVDGRPVAFRSPVDAVEAGMGMVHQAFRLFPSMTVAENVVYGHEPTKGWFLDRPEANARVAALAASYGLGVDESQCLIADSPDVITQVQSVRDQIVAGEVTVDDPAEG